MKVKKMSMTYPRQMDEEFKQLTVSVFKDYLVCGFINGRGALYLTGKDMDIDVCIVLKDQIVDKQNDFRKMWKDFVIGYRNIHIKYEFKPDNAFPGDFLTVSQAYDVVSGRGFVEKNGQIYIQPMGSITDESDENDYRIFRSMFIIGRCIVGNKSFFKELKMLSIITLIKYFFIINKKLSIKDIIGEFLSGAEKEKYGFDKRYEPAFSTYIKPLVSNALDQLFTYGYIKKQNDRQYVMTQELLNWGKDILTRVWISYHLMKFRDPYYVKERKSIFSNIKAGSHWDKLS